MTRANFVRADPKDRRNALIAATAACLARYGVAGTSVRAICAEAGVSQGLLRHYFDGVHSLVAETYRSVTEMVAAAHLEAVEAAGSDPRKRLIAFLTASFRSPVSDPTILSTWLAFWSLVKTDPAIAAIHGETYAGYRADLVALLVDCGVKEGDAATTAIALTALVDGLWLELCLDPTTFTADQAGRMAIRWLGALIGE